MSHLAELASLLFNMVILTVVLSVVGWGVSKVLHHVLGARRQATMNSEALLAAAKSRAAARSALREQSSYSSLA